MKICSKCKIEKSFDEFYKNKNAPDGHRYWCVPCTNSSNDGWYANNKIKRKKSLQEWRNKNPELIRELQKNFHRRNRVKEKLKRYGISIDIFNSLLSKQNNKCKICPRVLDSHDKIHTPHIDHDHSCCKGPRSCGKCIRGIICHSCNQVLGHCYDDVNILKSASSYLEEYAKTR